MAISMGSMASARAISTSRWWPNGSELASASRIALEADEVEQLESCSASRRLLAPQPRRDERAVEKASLGLSGEAGEHVLQHRQAAEQLRGLEGAGDAQPRDAVRGRGR